MAEIVGNVGLTGVFLIDIAIGVLFAVLIFSLVATALAEAISGMLNYRGEHLRRGIIRLLSDDAVAREVLEHPTIRSLKGPKNLVQQALSFLFMWGAAARDPDRMPSSIPKDSFARALVEGLVARRDALEAGLDGVEARAERALELVGGEIDKLALDRRLKTRLKAVVGRIDFDRIEAELGARVEGALDRGAAVAEALGIELDALGVPDAVKAGARAALERADIGGIDDRLAERIDAAVDAVGLEARLKSEVRGALARLNPAALRRQAEALAGGALAHAEAALAEAQAAVEAELARWFDEAMDRVSGWYVRRAKTMLFVIGFGLSAGMGFDVIGYAQQLARDDAMRSAIVARAQAAASSGEIGTFRLAPAPAASRGSLAGLDANGDGRIDEGEAARADEMLRAAVTAVGERAREGSATIASELGHMAGPIGASFWAASGLEKGRMVLSFLLIGLGCTLGGQFWFDLLRSLLKVRAGASGLVTDRERPAG